MEVVCTKEKKKRELKKKGLINKIKSALYHTMRCRATIEYLCKVTLSFGIFNWTLDRGYNRVRYANIPPIAETYSADP